MTTTMSFRFASAGREWRRQKVRAVNLPSQQFDVELRYRTVRGALLTWRYIIRATDGDAAREEGERRLKRDKPHLSGVEDTRVVPIIIAFT